MRKRRAERVLGRVPLNPRLASTSDTTRPRSHTTPERRQRLPVALAPRSPSHCEPRVDIYRSRSAACSGELGGRGVGVGSGDGEKGQRPVKSVPKQLM